MRRGREFSERGQVTILVIGFAVVVMLLIAVVASASAVFLQRRSLMAWADGAALTAVQNVSEPAIYGGVVGDKLPLSAPAARQSVNDYVARHGLVARFDGFRVRSVTVDEPQGVVSVTFAAHVELPFAQVIGSGWGRAEPIAATATATAPLRR